MDDPRTNLQAALKDAMRNKDVTRRNVIRFALNAIKQVEIDGREEVPAEDAMAILQKEAKKRRESIAEMSKAGRDDLAEQEQTELTILEAFLPRQLEHDELAALAQEAIVETGAASDDDIGKVMRALMPKVKGLADGKRVNHIVRELLGA